MIAHRNGWAALVTAVVGLGCAGLGYAARGADGAWSALLAAAVVVAFMSAGSIPLVVAGDTQHGRGALAFLVLAVNYALRLALALVVLKLASRSDWVSGTAVGVTAIACTVAWTGAQLYFGTARRHQPTLDV